MADLLTEFLDNPNGETYLPLREAIIAMPEFDMFSDGLTRMQDYMDADAPENVLAMVPELMPNWLLSPQVHSLISQAAEARGDAARARSESLMFEACMYGLSQTGDGSAAAPYAVVQVADEYAIAQFLDKQPTGHRRDVRDGIVIDVLTCADDSEICFDVTENLAAMAGT